MKNQKTIFLEGEGDAWFRRNKSALGMKNCPNDDVVLQELIALFPSFLELNVLEVGCGGGERLAWLKMQGANAFGVDPSAAAVDEAVSRGVTAHLATADAMPYEANKFDIVIVGFCLYLCDRQDLFKISSEINRVLKPNAWLVLLDFYSECHVSNPYIHTEDVYSFKMDYSSMFMWHPAYFLTVQKIVDHNDFRKLTDVENDMMGLQILRKKSE